MHPGTHQPGWYLDPADPGMARYYDGNRFTSQAQQAPDGYVDPAGRKLVGRLLRTASAEEQAAWRQHEAREAAKAAGVRYEPEADQEAGSLLDRFETKHLILGGATLILLVIATLL